MAIKDGGLVQAVGSQRAAIKARALELLSLPRLEDWAQRWEIASEEAGHCCVGMALGGTVGSVEARPDGGKVVFVCLPEGPVANAAIDLAGRQARDPMSVKAAVSRGSWSDIRLLLSKQDFENIVGTKGASFEGVVAGAELARRCLSDYKESFQCLRAALLRKPVLSGEEALALFRLPDPR